MKRGRSISWSSSNSRLQKDIRYLVRMEPGVQTCEETLELGSGSCRDIGWLLVQILRHLGFAARFVSGYLIQLKPDEKPLEGPAGAAEDFTDLHAWTEVYLPGAGWIGLDPTSGLLAGEGHLPLACTPDPESAAPITGSVDAADVAFSFSMSVERIRETPRVTKPYTDHQWQAILALGEQVDDRLTEDDVRLTVGGEPTFVSIDDMDGAEWNSDADGPAETRAGAGSGAAAARPVRARRAAAFRTGQVVSRRKPAALGLRASTGAAMASPLWTDHAARRHRRRGAARSASTTPGASPRHLAQTLGCRSEYVMPAYEDPLPYIARERTLPENVDPFDSKLEDPEERARLARVFERGLGKPTGWVLPVQRWNARDGRRAG